ncbi:MAG: family N-acetyltransferase [Paenibacillus sp.]|jgi:GNAT superfamily N-acetyltransferase|nr:family N-acetyltransferase [Paenibacillus sp.]
MEDISLSFVEPSNPELLHLISKLDEELFERYPAEEVFGINFDDPMTQEIVFVVAYMNRLPVGCGGIRPLDNESTELKRFFVDKPYRNRGVAARILNLLEKTAKQLKFKYIRLETGVEQPESVHFYKKHGYKETDKFGDYIDCESSLCYEKRII